MSTPTTTTTPRLLRHESQAINDIRRGHDTLADMFERQREVYNHLASDYDGADDLTTCERYRGRAQGVHTAARATEQMATAVTSVLTRMHLDASELGHDD